MKKEVLLIMAIIMLLVAACSPGVAGDEPTVVQPDGAVSPESDSDVPALDTAVPSVTPSPAEALQPERPADPAEEDMDTEDMLGEPASPTDGESQVVTPVEVNVSELTPEPTVIGTPVEMPAPGRPGAQQERMVQEATLDLAKRLDIDPAGITVLSVEFVDWPDGSLGCPAPGMAYIMVITPGYKIVLSAAGEEYDYHTDMRGYFVLCGADGAPVP